VPDSGAGYCWSGLAGFGLRGWAVDHRLRSVEVLPCAASVLGSIPISDDKQEAQAGGWSDHAFDSRRMVRTLRTALPSAAEDVKAIVVVALPGDGNRPSPATWPSP
jgi:hypothetical protein